MHRAGRSMPITRNIRLDQVQQSFVSLLSILSFSVVWDVIMRLYLLVLDEIVLSLDACYLLLRIPHFHSNVLAPNFFLLIT
jgi:hypothetical protein